MATQVVAVIYDPTVDAFARVVRRGRRWLAQCQGREQDAWHEMDAVGRAERMLGQLRERRGKRWS